MRHAKSHSGAGTSDSGISGLLTNYDEYQRWVQTTYARSLSRCNTWYMADMGYGREDDKHCDVCPTNIRKGKKLKKVQNIITSFINPFSVDTKDEVLLLSSGSAASAGVTAETIGQKTWDDFIEMWLKTSFNLQISPNSID